MGQKNAKSKISSTSQESNSTDETEEKLDHSFDHNKLELENKENIKTSMISISIEFRQTFRKNQKSCRAFVLMTKRNR